MGDLSIQPRQTIYLSPAAHSAERLTLASKKSESSLTSGSSEGCLSSIWNKISSFFSSMWIWITGLFSSPKSSSSTSKTKSESAEPVKPFTLTSEELDKTWKSFASQKRIDALCEVANYCRPYDSASALQFVWWIKVDKTPVLIHSERVNYGYRLKKENISPNKFPISAIKLDQVSQLEMHGMCIVRSCNESIHQIGDFRFFHTSITATAGVEDPEHFLKKFKVCEPINFEAERHSPDDANVVVNQLFGESLDSAPKKEMENFITDLRFKDS